MARPGAAAACECPPALVTFLSLLVPPMLWAAPLSLPFPYPRALSPHVRFYPTTVHSTIEMFPLEPACAGMATLRSWISLHIASSQEKITRVKSRPMALANQKPRRGYRSKQIVTELYCDICIYDFIHPRHNQHQCVENLYVSQGPTGSPGASTA